MAALGRPQLSTDDPTATIDLSAVSANLAAVRGLLEPNTKVLAAVKADAYGHGLLPIARRLAADGVNWFGVATVKEALELRAGGITGGALVLSPVRDPTEIAAAAAAGVTLTVTDEASLSPLLAANLPGTLSVQLKLDTGMGRLGSPATSATAVAASVARAGGLQLEGVYTHFASADEADTTTTELQLELFHAALTELEAAGLNPPLVHAANSAGIIAYPSAQFSMVRAGIVLYGHHPSAWIAARGPQLRQVMRLEAPVTFVKRVSEGTAVSYGGTWRAPHATTIATVRLGYADGYRRALGGVAWAGVRGQRCPVVGRVCMDQLMIDLGELSTVQPGERVTLWGEGGPSASELASSIGTISYELLTGVGARVARVYVA